MNWIKFSEYLPVWGQRVIVRTNGNNYFVQVSVYKGKFNPSDEWIPFPNDGAKPNQPEPPYSWKDSPYHSELYKDGMVLAHIQLYFNPTRRCAEFIPITHQPEFRTFLDLADAKEYVINKLNL